MAARSTPSDKVVIDPIFGVPSGAEDIFVYTQSATEFDNESTSTEDILEVDSYDVEPEDEFVDYEDGYDPSNGQTLETPSGFIVLSQTLRRAPGGQQVVDLVVEVPDIDGAMNYELEVAKV